MKKPLDILVICPLKQEMEVCTRVLFAARGGQQNAGQRFPDQKRKLLTQQFHGHSPLYASMINNLMVGVIHIGSAGNTHAALECGPILEAMRPKVVFLTGIAGGRHSTVSLGDVIYNKSVVYSSLAKIAGREPDPVDQEALLKQVDANSELTLTEKNSVKSLIQLGIRIKLREPPLFLRRGHINIAHKYADVVRRVSSSSEEEDRWQKIAKTLFEDLREQARDGADLWIHDGHVWHSAHQDPKCHCVGVASGEIILASEAFQAALKHAVKDEFGNSFTVDAFEMEAYAVNALCNRANIHFITIRGISDPATEFKDTPKHNSAEARRNGSGAPEGMSEEIKKDCHHLAAACVAGAFTRAIIMNDDFQNEVQKLPSPPALSPAVPCADVQARSWCLHKPQEKCVDLGILSNELVNMGIGDSQSLIRVYEGVKENEFSNLLYTMFNNYLGSRVLARVLLLFPYSTRDLFRLLEIPNGKSLDEATAYILRIKTEILRKFKHFVKIEEYAKWLSNQREPGKDEKIGVTRIILKEGTSRFVPNEKRMYGALLLEEAEGGTNIDTRKGDSLLMLNEGFVADDVVIVESVEDEESWLRALRYFPKSRLLVVRGWHCGSALRQQEMRKDDALNQMWQRWKSGLLPFEEFKFVEGD